MKKKTKNGMVIGLIILLVGAGVVSSISGMNISQNNINTLILKPNAPGQYNQHQPGTGDNWKLVSDDNYETYVIEDSSDGRPDDQYNIQDYTIETGQINSVTVYVIAKGGHYTWTTPSLYIDGELHRGSQKSIPYDWTIFSDTWINNPSTDAAWTWDDIDILQIGTWSESAPDGDDTLICEVYAEINYIPPGDDPPSVTTNAAGSITKTTATLNGNLDSLGDDSSCDVWFQYGLTTSYDSSTPHQSRSSTGSFNSGISGLTCGNTYHFRAVAQNSIGTDYGSDLTFTTDSCGGGGDIEITYPKIGQWCTERTCIPVSILEQLNWGVVKASRLKCETETTGLIDYVEFHAVSLLGDEDDKTDHDPPFECEFEDLPIALAYTITATAYYNTQEVANDVVSPICFWKN